MEPELKNYKETIVDHELKCFECCAVIDTKSFQFDDAKPGESNEWWVSTEPGCEDKTLCPHCRSKYFVREKLFDKTDKHSTYIKYKINEEHDHLCF